MNFSLCNVVFLLFLYIINVKGQCWKRSFGRGVGTAINSCTSDELELNGALCYDKCRDGFYGVGPVCWSKCSEGYADYGAICWNNTHIFGKGCCCTIFNLNCCGNCPKDYTDDDCTCRRDVKSYVKESYGRGFGSPMVCSKEQDYYGGLCYPKCGEYYYGNGPFCYQKCIAPLTYDCGGFCGLNVDECTRVVLLMIKAGINITQTGAALFNLLPFDNLYQAFFGLDFIGKSNRSSTLNGIIIDTVKVYLFDLCSKKKDVASSKEELKNKTVEQRIQAESIVAVVIAQLERSETIEKPYDQSILEFFQSKIKVLNLSSSSCE